MKFKFNEGRVALWQDGEIIAEFNCWTHKANAYKKPFSDICEEWILKDDNFHVESLKAFVKSNYPRISVWSDKDMINYILYKEFTMKKQERLIKEIKRDIQVRDNTIRLINEEKLRLKLQLIEEKRKIKKWWQIWK